MKKKKKSFSKNNVSKPHKRDLEFFFLSAARKVLAP